MLVAEAKSCLAGIQANRLLCTSDALPFGVGLSIETDIPLVYSRGSNDVAVHDLVGAYDIGHPVVLLMNIFADFDSIAHFVDGAKQVGLEINSVLVIVNLGIAPLPQNIPTYALLRLPSLIKELELAGQLPTPQANVIEQWLESRMELDVLNPRHNSVG
jgi:hypothetical protein